MRRYRVSASPGGMSAMQTQTQVPGPQQNGNVLNRSGVPWLRWQSDEDISTRRDVVEGILRLFKERQPYVTPEVNRMLPNFVRRLEEASYKNAPSKEEYADVNTLAARLQYVSRPMVPQQPQQSELSSAPMSNMTPTPGAASN